MIFKKTPGADRGPTLSKRAILKSRCWRQYILRTLGLQAMLCERNSIAYRIEFIHYLCDRVCSFGFRIIQSVNMDYLWGALHTYQHIELIAKAPYCSPYLLFIFNLVRNIMEQLQFLLTFLRSNLIVCYSP